MDESTEMQMKLYLGTKALWAIPMNRGDYNEYRGWETPEDEDTDEEGMLVEYTCGGEPNHPKHDGYISWSPLDVFDNTYREPNGLSFGVALEALRSGAKVCREGWNGKGMFIFLVDGSTFKVSRPPLLGIYPEGTEINYHAHIDMKTADDQVVPWLASQTDVLAEDWMMIEPDRN